MNTDWIKKHKVKLSIITLSVISIIILVYFVLRVKDDTNCKDGTTNMNGNCSKCITPCEDTNFKVGDGCICSCEQKNGNEGLVFDKDDAVWVAPDGVGNISAETISDSSLKCKTKNFCTADQLMRGFKDTLTGCECPSGGEPCTYNDTSGGDPVEVEYCCQDPTSKCIDNGEICCPTWMTKSDGSCCPSGTHVSDKNDCISPCGIGVCPKTDDEQQMICKFLVAPNKAACGDDQTLDDCLNTQWEKEQKTDPDNSTKVVKLAVDKDGKNLSSYDSTSNNNSIKVLPYCLYGLERPQPPLLFGSTSTSHVSMPPLALKSWFSLNTDQSKILVPETDILNTIILTQNYENGIFKTCAGQNNSIDHDGAPPESCQFLLLNQLPTVIKASKGDSSSSLINLIKTFMEEYIKNTIPEVDGKEASIYGRYMMEDGADEDPYAVKILIDKVPDSEVDKTAAANKIVRDYITENSITKKDDGPDLSDIVGVTDDGTFLAVILNIDYDSPTDNLDAITQRCKQSLGGAEISPTPISSSALPEQPYYPLKNSEDTNKITGAPSTVRCTEDRQLIDISSSNNIKYVNTDGVSSNAKVPFAYGNVPWNTAVGTKATWDPAGDPSIPTLGPSDSLLYTSFGPACIPVPVDGIDNRTDFWNVPDGRTKNDYKFDTKKDCEDANKCYGIYMRGSDGTCNVSPCSNDGKLPVIDTESHPYNTMPLHGNPTTAPSADDPLLFIQGKDACYRKVPVDKIMDEKCEWANSSPFSSGSKCSPHKGARTPNGTHAAELGFAANCRHNGNMWAPACHGYAYDNLIDGGVTVAGKKEIWSNVDGAPSYKWCLGPKSSHEVCVTYTQPPPATRVCSDIVNNDWRWLDISKKMDTNTISKSYDSGDGTRAGKSNKPEYGCTYGGRR